MIVRFRPAASEEAVQQERDRLERSGLRTVRSPETERPILGVIDETEPGPLERLRASPDVEQIIETAELPVLVHRAFRESLSVARVGGVRVGGEDVVVIAGPCSVEGREAMLALARQVRDAGAHLLRGGAFKPRTSPYSFQGFGVEGLRQ